MKRIILSVFFAFTFFSFCLGDCTVRGKITDENGEVIIGATIVLKSNNAVGAATDFEGNYTINIPDSIPQTLVISYISYQTAEEVIHPVKGEVVVKNVSMKSATQTISDVVVVAKAVRANEYFMENVKKKSATSIDYISSETMKKTGDVNVTAAVTRVPGVSTTSNGFFTVRGIGDRYVKTAINGSRIPTLDPFSNNIKLDLFPASLVDNVIITKTASPDLPGDWAGAYLSIETKDYPDKLTINAEASAGYNTQSTFKDVISSDRSSTDWLGYDNGFREHDHTNFATAVINPNQYQQFVALGLGPYYQSLGITGLTSNQSTNDVYIKLGLVKLGLLAPAQFNDQTAVNNAKNSYSEGTYSNQAFNIINANVPKVGQSFPDNWNPVTRVAPLNESQSFSIGNQTKLFGKPLGFLFGYRYGSYTLYDPNAESNRWSVTTQGTSDVPSEVSARRGQYSKELNGWSALCNLAYKLNPNNSVSVLFMPNLTGVNLVRSMHDSLTGISSIQQFYEERRQLVYQLKSEHYIPGPKLKIELDASYTNGQSNAPDFKNVEFQDALIGPEVGNGIHRYYRYLTDNLFDSRLSLEIPLANAAKAGTRKLKVGVAYQNDKQTGDRYDYSLNFGNSRAPLINGDLDSYFSLNQFAINNNSINWFYVDNGNAADHSFGRSSVKAAFAMVDYALTPLLRFSGGLRVEQAYLYTDIDKFDSLGLPPNDPRRNYSIELPDANPGKLDEVNFLPSANIIYKLKDDEFNPINLRLNYSKAVARPSIREKSDFAVYDFEQEKEVFGNSDLKTVQIDNYDLRAESYFKNGDNVSVSIFYKNFTNDIEIVDDGASLTWHNADKSSVKGIELEGNKVLGRHFDFKANVSLVHSVTSLIESNLEIIDGIKTYIPTRAVSRAMYGQAPYVINGILGYHADSLGLGVTLSYNVQGSRLSLVSNNPASSPDVYELPRNVLDCKITKSLTKHFGASLTVRDILNAPIRRAYDYADGWKDYDKYTYGTNYVFSLSYKL